MSQATTACKIKSPRVAQGATTAPNHARPAVEKQAEWACFSPSDFTVSGFHH